MTMDACGTMIALGSNVLGVGGEPGRNRELGCKKQGKQKK